MATQQPGNEQIIQRLDTSVKGLDELRGESLKRTELLQGNKDKALKKEQQRLQKKYGDDHPRVTKINNRIEYNKRAIPEIKQEFELAQIKVPDFDASLWMVHGRVLNNKLKGVGGLTLSLFDASGKVEKRMGYACTDATGYYAIRYQFEEGKTPPFNEDTPFQLTVSGDKGKICHQEERPLFVIAGQVDFRQIIIDEKICTPPPGWNDDEDNDDGDDDGQTGNWSVTGTVVYANGKPGTSLRVDLISKQTEESLINVNTGRTGKFGFKLSTQNYPDVFKQETDLFVVVSNLEGRRLHVPEKPLRVEVGGEETLEIVIKLAIENDDDDGQTGSWTVTGTVGYSDGKPGTSLRVDLISKQTKESLINVNTGRTGKFGFKLSTQKYHDIFKQETDLIVAVSDLQGQRLHVTRKPLQAKVGAEEKLKIEIKRANVDRG